jgi:hypothetical protein
MLVNLSDDPQVLENLAPDDAFLELLLQKITVCQSYFIFIRYMGFINDSIKNPKEPNANEIAMLLANLAKSDSIKRIISLKRAIPKPLSSSGNAMDQLMDCFVKGSGGRYNEHADFDYLSYFFADIAKFPEGRTYFVTPQAHDSDIIPLTKLIVFTEHQSIIRRRGVASTIKNVGFEVDSHARLMASDEVNVLPYIMLPVMGSEEYDDEDTEGMLDDLQLLSPDKEREQDPEILKTHLETLLLLTTTRRGRDLLRAVKLYPIIRETHLHVEDEDVREICDRIVQVIMRDEEDDQKINEAELKGSELDANKQETLHGKSKIVAVEEDDEDDQIIEIL